MKKRILFAIEAILAMLSFVFGAFILFRSSLKWDNIVIGIILLGNGCFWFYHLTTDGDNHEGF